LKVYDNNIIDDLESDIQISFFSSMSLLKDGQLLIKNEAGEIFKIDVNNINKKLKSGSRIPPEDIKTLVVNGY